MKKFDLIKPVLRLKFMSLGYTMVTLRSETLLYMSTLHHYDSLSSQISIMILSHRKRKVKGEKEALIN